MIIQFQGPVTEKQQEMIKKMFGDDVAAIDSRTVLINGRHFNQQDLKEIANETNQVVTLELNDPDTIGLYNIINKMTLYKCLIYKKTLKAECPYCNKSFLFNML